MAGQTEPFTYDYRDGNYSTVGVEEIFPRQSRHDDLRIIDRFIEYDKKDRDKVAYFTYLIDKREDDGEWMRLVKVVKLCKVYNVPKELREMKALMVSQDELLSSIWKNDTNFICIYCNMPPDNIGDENSSKGFYYCYGVQCVMPILPYYHNDNHEGIWYDEDTEESEKIIMVLNAIKKQADAQFTGLVNLLRGNFRQSQFLTLTMKEAESIRRTIEEAPQLQVIRGIPHTHISSASGVTTSMNGITTTPEGIEQNEEFIRGLLHERYANVIMAVPIPYEEILQWSQNTAKELTLYKSQYSGAISHNAGLSIPMVFAGNLSATMGNTQGITDTTGETLGNTEGTSSSYSHGVGTNQGTSHNLGLTDGQSVGVADSVSQANTNSASQGLSNSHTLSNSTGVSMTESNGTTHGVSNTQSLGRSHTVGTSESFSEGDSITQSRSHSIGKSTSLSHSIGETLGQTQGITRGLTHGITDGTSLTQGHTVGQTQGITNGITQGHTVGNTTGQTITDGISNGISHSVGRSNTISNGLTDTVSNGTSNTNTYGQTIGNTNTVGHTLGTTVGHTDGTSYTEGRSQTFTDGDSYTRNQGKSWNNGSTHTTADGMGQVLNYGASFKLPFVSGNEGFSFNGSLTNSDGVTHSGGGSTGESWGKTHSEANGLSISHGETHSDSNSYSNSNSYSQGVTNSNSTSHSIGNTLSNSHGVSHSQSMGNTISDSTTSSNTHSVGHSTSQSISDSTSRSLSNSLSNSISDSLSKGLTHSISNSNSLSNSLSNSHSLSNSYGLSQGVTEGYSEGISRGKTFGHSLGNTVSDGITKSISQGTTDSNSHTLSNGLTRSQSVGDSIGRTSSLSQGESSGLGKTANQGLSKSLSNAIGTSNGTSLSDSRGTGTTASQSTALSNAQGLSTAKSNALGMGQSTNFSFGPTIGVSKTYQFFDEMKGNLIKLLEVSNDRWNLASQTGAFHVDAYVVSYTPAAAQSIQLTSTTSWGGKTDLSTVQCITPDEFTQNHLMKHVSVFEPCTMKETIPNVADNYLWSTIMLTSELSAMTHLPRVETGGISTVATNIPSFSVFANKEGEIYFGKQINYEDGLPSYDYYFSKKEFMHTLICGASGSGKTTSAVRMAREVIKNYYDMKIFALDWKNSWRVLKKFAPNGIDDFEFYGLDASSVRPIRMNVFIPPKHVGINDWVDKVLESICLGYGFGNKMYSVLKKATKIVLMLEGVLRLDKNNAPVAFTPLNQEEQDDFNNRIAQVTMDKVFLIVQAMKNADGKSPLSNTCPLEIYTQLEKKHLSGILADNEHKYIEEQLTTKAGMGMNDAFDSILAKLEVYYSGDLRKLYCHTVYDECIHIEDLIDGKRIVVLEGGDLDTFSKKAIIGLISWGMFMYSRLRKNIEKIVEKRFYILEEAHRIVDNPEAGNVAPLDVGETIFDIILNEAREYGVYAMVIVQTPTHIPPAMITNCAILIIHRLGNDKDIQLMTQMLCRNARLDNRDVPIWLAKEQIGTAIVRLSNTIRHQDSEPCLVQVARCPNDPPDNEELVLELEDVETPIYMRREMNTDEYLQAIKTNLDDFINEVPNNKIDEEYRYYHDDYREHEVNVG